LSYLRPDGGEMDLGDPEVETLQADVLLKFIRLVEQLRLETPAKEKECHDIKEVLHQPHNMTMLAFKNFVTLVYDQKNMYRLLTTTENAFCRSMLDNPFIISN
jgi:hypothetical protein